jgi:hypothetical protein
MSWQGDCSSGAMMMRCVVLSLPYVALLALPQSAVAAEPPRQVATVRSDGALYPGVAQRGRREQARRSDITLSRRLEPPPGQWRNEIEPASGGGRIAPADGAEAQQSAPIVILVEVPTHMPRRHRQSLRPRQTAP